MHEDTERATGRGSVSGEAAHQPFDHPEARPSLGGHPHGKRSSWVLVSADVLAFLAGGTALIMHYWWLFWVCAGVVALSVPAGWAIRITDDTVVWGSTAGVNAASLPDRAQEHTALRQQGGGPGTAG